MQTYIVLLLSLSFMGYAQSQNWVGNYSVGAACSPSLCCCLTGPVYVSTVSTGFSNFFTGLNGSGILCGGQTSYTTNLTTPTSYTTIINILNAVFLNLTLSSNSQTITVINIMSTSCVSTLTKTSSSAAAVATSTSNLPNNISQSNIWLLFIMALIILMKNVLSM